MIEQAKFTYSPLEKAFEKQTKDQFKVTKDLNISDKANELKQTGGIFRKNVLNDLISNKLKKIIELQNSIELDKLDHKNYDFDKVPLPSIFLIYIYIYIYLSIEYADNEQSDLFKLLSKSKKGRKPPEKN